MRRFLRDFLYNAGLLVDERVHEKGLPELREVVEISQAVIDGISNPRRLRPSWREENCSRLRVPTLGNGYPSCPGSVNDYGTRYIAALAATATSPLAFSAVFTPLVGMKTMS